MIFASGLHTTHGWNSSSTNPVKLYVRLQAKCLLHICSSPQFLEVSTVIPFSMALLSPPDLSISNQ